MEQRSDFGRVETGDEQGNVGVAGDSGISSCGDSVHGGTSQVSQDQSGSESHLRSSGGAQLKDGGTGIRGWNGRSWRGDEGHDVCIRNGEQGMASVHGSGGRGGERVFGD